MKQKYETLIFQHSSVLTSDLLESFLCPSLERLDLCYCEKIDNKAVSIIQKQCPNLKALSLAGCVGVTEIAESSFYPKFTNLEDLDVSHCSNLHTLKLEAHFLQNLKGSHNPLLQEVKLGSEVVKTASPQVDITRPPCFGKKEWAKYFGEIGVEPPLPQNIHEILNSPCLFWPDKKVSDTHLLVLVPATVNGKPLTLNSLEELIQKPKEGHKTKYNYYRDHVKNELGNQSTSSHWVLMTRDVIPESRSKAYEDQKKLVAAYAQKSGQPYELPTALDAMTCILMEHVQTGIKLYNDNPLTYTRCQEKVDSNQWPVAIGGFAAGGLDVHRPLARLRGRRRGWMVEVLDNGLWYLGWTMENGFWQQNW